MPRVGGYTITGELGSGACGVVYAGLSPSGERVAIKTIFPGFARARFARECRILQALDHPSIVAVRDLIMREDNAFLVMEQVQGTTIGELLHERHTFQPVHVIEVAIAMAGALAHAHEAGVVHRDVSPGNILVDDDLKPRLADFGIARDDEDTVITQHGELLGTPGFLAPEVIDGADAGPGADQFGLGRTLFEMSCRPDRPMARPRGVLGVLTASLDIRWNRMQTGPVWHRLRPLMARMMRQRPEDRFSSLAATEAAWLSLLERPTDVPDADSTHTSDLPPLPQVGDAEVTEICTFKDVTRPSEKTDLDDEPVVVNM